MTGGERLKRIDKLLQEARRLGSQWKPSMILITGEQGDYHLVVQEWDGKPGSAKAPEHRQEYHHVSTKGQAEQIAQAVVQAYRDKTQDRHFEPCLLDMSIPATDEERRAVWQECGGTTLERMAETDGLSLKDEIKEVYGPDVVPENMPVFADIIRWRREAVNDGEATVKVVYAE